MVVEGKCIVCDSIKDKCITNKLGLVCFECISDGRFDEYESKFSTIFIKDENGKEYRFEKPEFECELLKVVDFVVIGYVKASYCEKIGGHWNMLGEFVSGRANYKEYNLTPIKSKWYEDGDMIGKYAITTDTKEMFIVKELVDYGCVSSEEFVAYNADRCRPATKEEILTLCYLDKEK